MLQTARISSETTVRFSASNAKLTTRAHRKPDVKPVRKVQRYVSSGRTQQVQAYARARSRRNRRVRTAAVKATADPYPGAPAPRVIASRSY